MQKIKDITSKIALTAFYIAIIIEVMILLIDKSALINPFEGRLFQITFILFLFKACLTKYSWKEYLTIGLLLIVGILSYLITGRNELLRIILFLAACKNVNMIKCMKTVFWMTLTGCVMLILLSIFDILGTLSLTQDYGRGGMETRYVLGLGHPNALQCMVCTLTILGIYLYHNSWKWYHYLEVLVLNAFFFLLTDSKTAFIIAAVSIFLFFLMSTIKNKVILKFLIGGNVTIIAGSVILSIMCAKDAMCLWHYYWEGLTNLKIRFYLFLDILLTGRIHSLIETNNHEGIMATWSLFSRPENNYYFDMGWIRLFYWYGIIPALIIIIIMVIFIAYFVKNKKYNELIVFSMISLYTVVEAHIVSVYIARNYLLFIAGMYWCYLLQKSKE